MIMAAFAIAAMQAGNSSGSVYLDCVLPDKDGAPSPWGIKLNEDAGSIQVTLGQSDFQRPATYRPTLITFTLGTATVTIDRTTGVIRRQRTDKDGMHAAEGKCAVSAAKRAF